MSKFSITREIGIDAAHRVPLHGSKCRGLHGHRYTIQAVCEGALQPLDTEQAGMVLDFGFLKEEMMAHIDALCDHATILQIGDPLIEVLAHAAVEHDVQTKLYAVDFAPTAENLAAHWYSVLFPRVAERTNNGAYLRRIIVWETPNCMAAYPA